MSEDQVRRAGSDLLRDVDDDDLNALLAGNDPVEAAIGGSPPPLPPKPQARTPVETRELVTEQSEERPVETTPVSLVPARPKRRGAAGAHETTVFFRPEHLYLDLRIWALKHKTKASTVVSALVAMFLEDSAIESSVEARIMANNRSQRWI